MLKKPLFVVMTQEARFINGKVGEIYSVLPELESRQNKESGILMCAIIYGNKL